MLHTAALTLLIQQTITTFLMRRPHYVATSKHFGQRRPSALSFLSPLLRQDVCFVMIVIGPADHASFLFIPVRFFFFFSPPRPHLFLPPGHSEPDRGRALRVWMRVCAVCLCVRVCCWSGKWLMNNAG